MGCINDTLLTIRVAEDYGLTVAGLVLNDLEHRGEDASVCSNQAEIERLSNRQVIRTSFGAAAVDSSFVELLMASWR